jgi:hypothetical protein
MPDITWEAPFCAEGNNCFRLGTDADGNGYISVSGQEDRYLIDSVEALRSPIADIKAGKAALALTTCVLGPRLRQWPAARGGDLAVEEAGALHPLYVEIVEARRGLCVQIGGMGPTGLEPASSHMR